MVSSADEQTVMLLYSEVSSPASAKSQKGEELERSLVTEELMRYSSCHLLLRKKPRNGRGKSFVIQDSVKEP